ncbi:MAG TPA: hydrolase [Gemmatimonadaceae bacterium]|nr:hydrolase [Gemmatimonadaceae bacterium]
MNTYRPAWWLPGAHLQTLWGKFGRRQARRATRIERIDTPDGDFLDLHHTDAPENAPLLVLLHGLEGSIGSHYVQALLSEASRRAWHATVLIFRSCGAELNRARRFYHSGETSDLDLALEHLLGANPSSNIVLAGVSLGGNVLLKYLGEKGSAVSKRIKGAAAVSVPFDLSRAARHIDLGFSRVYRRSFIRSLRRKAVAKLESFPDLASRSSIDAATTMVEFDNSFTAPVHGFRDADEYYEKSSSIRWLERIRINTLLLNAVDDPFLPRQVLDDVRAIARHNPALTLEFPAGGGHVGFVSGRNPLRPVYYLEERVGQFLASQLQLD